MWAKPFSTAHSTGNCGREGENGTGVTAQVRSAAVPSRSSADAIEHGKKKIVHRRFALITDVPAGLNRPAAFAGEQDGQVVMVMAVAVTDPAAIDDHAIV